MSEIPILPVDRYIEIRGAMKKAYLADKRPWIVGFSGGKDSTLVAQLAFGMLMDLPESERKKEVHIITSDTLVETPFISERIKAIHKDIEDAARGLKLPIKVALLKPSINETFWVNLIGRGYPSPNRWFRWCTDRLKIRPATQYIYDQVKTSGEVIIVLGTRKAESAARSQTMEKHKIQGIQYKKHKIQGAFVYSPIEDLDNVMTWSCLKSVKSPWGGDNVELERLYRKADGDCPMVVDDSTQSCGGSRFGCWVCTVVKRDRSVEGLIEEGETWLEPLLEFRNWLHDIRDDPKMREDTRKVVRKARWKADYFGEEEFKDERKGHEALGPFTFQTRLDILKRLFDLQDKMNERDITLIHPEELSAIETIWAYEGGPTSALMEMMNGHSGDTDFTLVDPKMRKILADICFEHEVPINLIENLLIAENDFTQLSKKTGALSKLEMVIDRYLEVQAIKEGGNGL